MGTNESEMLFWASVKGVIFLVNFCNPSLILCLRYWFKLSPITN